MSACNANNVNRKNGTTGMSMSPGQGVRSSVAGWRAVGLLGLTLLGAEPAQAQVVTCPAAEQDYVTGSGCWTLQWVLPPAICGCGGGRLYSGHCWMGEGYITVGGVSGCHAYCTAAESNPPVPCLGDMEVTSAPTPRQSPAPPQACSAPGNPVSVISGEMFFSHSDAVVAEIAFTRSYNSARLSSTSRYGSFGPGWNASSDRRLRVMSAEVLEVRLSDGYPLYYADDDGDGDYQLKLPLSSESWVESVPGGFSRVLRAGGSELYDSSGRLQVVTDAAGVTTTYTRDGQGRLVSVSRRGRALSLEYEGAATTPARLRGPDGLLLASYDYDPQTGRLSAVDYPDGNGYRYLYDSGGRVLLVRDATGKPVEAHEYDAQGRATTSEIADGREKLTFSYGTNQTTVTNALGHATVYDWANVQHMNRVTKITGPCSSCGGGGTGETQEWTYDSLGQVTAYKRGTDAWAFTFDPSGDMLTETDPLNRTTTYTYDAQGRVLSVALPGGGATTTTYGPAGPLTITEAVTATENRTTTLTYTVGGQVETVTDPRSKVSTFAYDALKGDLLSVTDPLTHPTTFTYDALGRRTSVTDALSHTTTTTYDARGRVSRVTQHDGTHTDFAYDQSGRRTRVTDPLGRVTRYLYDDWGRLTAVVDPLSQTTAYAYDLMGQLTSLTDAKGQATAFEYDGYGRVMKTIYPGGGQEVFTYDSRGRLETKTDRKAIVTTYAYDVLGRLTGKTYSDGTPAVSYTYDPAGRLETAANGTDTLTWAYDLAGQLLSEQSSKNGSTVAYTYDAAGNRLTLGLDGQLFVSYAYDDASRLTGISRGANVFGFGYDAVNRRTSMSYPNGVATTYSYDNLNRLLRLKADKGANAITDFQYTYDASGNRLSKQQLDYTETYGYDPLYRLTDVTRGASLTRYSYDSVGNRLGEQADASVISGTFDEKNQLLARSAGGTLRWRGSLSEPGNVSFSSATVNGKPARMLAGNVFEADIPATAGSNAVTLQATDTSGNVTTKNYSVSVGGNGASYTYDPNGNLTSKVEDGHSWTYEWNAENQLKRVLKDAVEVARFAYDPAGRRLEKAAGATTVTYVYDHEDILKQLTGTSTVRYVHGPGIDEPVATENGAGQLTYEHADGLGSELKQTDSTGAVTFSRSYDAFGQLQVGASDGGYAFTGREWDTELGLYYYRARYYDPKVGGFVSQDPIRFKGGPNFYSYAENRASTLFDPTGLRIRRHMAPMFPPNYGGQAPNGSAGTRFSVSYVGSRSCRPRGPTYHFDVDVNVVIEQVFTIPPDSASRESPGLSVAEHEDLHVSDLTAGTDPAFIEQIIPTEGFTSLRACECARTNLPNNLDPYLQFLEVYTGSRRDTAGDTSTP